VLIQKQAMLAKQMHLGVVIATHKQAKKPTINAKHEMRIAIA
jgi:hypothetical protein